MEKIIKKVISLIEKSGFEAYVVGGYVRDLILGKISYDVDICTNALPKDLVEIFPDSHVGIYGAVSFKIKKYSFEITTYREELKYKKRHPSEINYISNLLEDLQRRDFTINTLCLSSTGNLIDLLDAKSDLDLKIIKCIGDINKKITDDPLRMLRAIRFATILNFSIEENLWLFICKESYLIKTLSNERIKSEIDKILLSENYKYGLNLLECSGILLHLELSYDKNIRKINDLNGMWAQINFENNLAFTKESRHNIDTLKKIIKYGRIDNVTLYYYGLYLNLVAAEILNLDKKLVNGQYKQLPIYNLKDLCVSANNIMEFLNIKEGKIIGIILDDLVLQILKGNLKNEIDDIYNYIDKFKEEENEN